MPILRSLEIRMVSAEGVKVTRNGSGEPSMGPR